MRILLVEAEDTFADTLASRLRQDGHEVDRASTGAAALAAAERAEFVLLEFALPDLDGLEVCRRIRGVSTVPIIVVTARDDALDRVLALHEGADDYVVKPFAVRELLARIEAVTRRAHAPVSPGDSDHIRQVGSLRVDTRTREVTLSGAAVRLTRREFDLLALLAAQPGTVRRREEIIARVWGENWFGSTRTLNVHVAGLRSKLGDPRWIQTLRGVGYRLVAPDF